VDSRQLELVQAQVRLQKGEAEEALAIAGALCPEAAGGGGGGAAAGGGGSSAAGAGAGGGGAAVAGGGSAAAVTPEGAARAALICADAWAALGDWPQRLEALRVANSTNSSPQTLRRLADAYLERAGLVSSANEKASLYADACSYLKTLCEQPWPGVLDRLNYSTALRASGDLAASERLLLQLASEVPGDYRVPMQLAFLYEQKDDAAKARSYCTQALTQIASAGGDTAGNATGSGSASTGKELLLALQRRLAQ
jgi:tetratricopeptide (TPR) repeat protein